MAVLWQSPELIVKMTQLGTEVAGEELVEVLVMMKQCDDCFL